MATRPAVADRSREDVDVGTSDLIEWRGGGAEVRSVRT